MRTPVPWLSEVLAVMEEIVEVCQEINDKVSGCVISSTLYIYSACFPHRLGDLIFQNYQYQQMHDH